ncbi:YqcI/YcgG family protein [Peribacillus kribbensis]|uniref:YqcI/YcgG family protein n=1 Tax=Peribacillus kribbensis TaxID=356658 RepID=UPI00041FF18C|nr:YqcI/YcgG family protein [Peribacillus kribbensis]
MTIYTNRDLFQMELEPWMQDAAAQFEKKMQDKEKPFPCIPATQGHQLEHFRYGFLPHPKDPASPLALAQALEEYTKTYEALGSYTSLILFYKNHGNELLTVKEYEEIFWNQLYTVSQQDTRSWPQHIPGDPHHVLWEFCFHEEQYFMYCGTPAHKNRKSRHFPYLMLAITPRSVLIHFNSSKSRSSKIKTSIRKRLADYDSVPIHPDLNTYGNEDNHEWKQYFLRDDDSSLSRCPFHQLSKAKNIKTDHKE